MPAEYYLQLKDPSGNVLAHVDDYLELAYSKKVWEPGLLTFKLNGDSSKIAYLTDNAQVEVFRRYPEQGIGWYKDFAGLFRGQTRGTPKDQNFFTAHCPGQMTMLSWAIVAWPDRVQNRSLFTALPAETVMKLLVTYNVTTAGATVANGRKATWPIPGIFVETDQGRGNLIDWKGATRNLLQDLQNIARIGGGDFDFVNTGGATWQFRFYPGQLGADRTKTVVFALEYGNMRDPVYTLDKINEATVAIVGGRGDNAQRQFQVVYGNTYSPTNYIETFVHASEQDTAAYMTARGQERLYHAQSRNKITFQVLQTPATQYGRDYFLGDLVTAKYKSITLTQKIHGVTVSYKDGLETLDVDIRDA